MLFCFYCETAAAVGLAGVNLSNKALEVRVHDVWFFHLLAVVLEHHRVCALFWHFRSRRAFQQPFAFRLMPFEQFFPRIAVQTALAKVLAFIVPALVI